MTALVYERAPDVPINNDVNQDRHGEFTGRRPYPGLIMADRYSASKRYYCPECRRPMRPVDMKRHRLYTHGVGRGLIAQWTYK